MKLQIQGNQRNNRFQGISCLISKEILLVKNTNFSNQRPYRSVSNEQISRDFLQQISKESLIPFGVLVS